MIESLMKAYYYLKSFRVTKSVSERNLMSNCIEVWFHEIDENSIRTSFFKATSGLINLARAGVKNILGDEDRSVVVQIVDELVNGKWEENMRDDSFIDRLLWLKDMGSMIQLQVEPLYQMMDQRVYMKMWLCLLWVEEIIVNISIFKYMLRVRIHHVWLYMVVLIFYLLIKYAELRELLYIVLTWITSILYRIEDERIIMISTSFTI